jgi:polyisoprenoid-binding protein YceI
MSKPIKIAGIVLVVALVAVGTGVWWFVLRDTAPSKASVAAVGTEPGSSASTRSSPDGTWKVKASSTAFVGYRISELFAGATVKRTAAGRTSKVEGTMTVDGRTIPAAEITADLTALESDQPRRDDSMGDHGLETDKFPSATFKLTKPITLPGKPTKGTTVDLDATGDLTVHGVTKPVTVKLQARWLGGTIAVAGSTPVALTDYKIDPLELSSLVKIDGRGTFELQLLFVPS